MYREDETPVGCRKLFTARRLPAQNTAMVAVLVQLELHGAFVSRELTAEVTHVVVDPGDLSRAAMIEV